MHLPGSRQSLLVHGFPKVFIEFANHNFSRLFCFFLLEGWGGGGGGAEGT